MRVFCSQHGTMRIRVKAARTEQRMLLHQFHTPSNASHILIFFKRKWFQDNYLWINAITGFGSYNVVQWLDNVLKKSTCNVCYSDEARTLSSTEAAVHVSAPAKSLVAVRKIPRLRLQQSLRCFTFISLVSNTCIVFHSHSRERAWTENIASCVGPLILHVLNFNSETSVWTTSPIKWIILNYWDVA